MDFVLVFPLILALISSGRCNPDQIMVECTKNCPAGYHLDGSSCSGGKRLCKQCGANTYTEIENTLSKCVRCRWCSGGSVTTKECSSTANRECGCKEGYYNAGSKETPDCQNCNGRCSRRGNDDFKLKCCPSLTATAAPLPAATSTTSATTVAPETPAASPSPDSTSRSIVSNSTPIIVPVPRNSQSLWLVVVVLVVIFLLFIWLLLVLNNNLCKKLDRFLCWTAKKDVELHAENSMINEQPSHRGSSPTTLTWTFTEENSTMPLNQSAPASEPPGLICPLLPDSDHLAARQCERSDQWPAIVLYAIIKEVPLRRWKEFLRLLNVADHQLERVELEAGFSQGSMERQYQMLRLWSQQSSASLTDVFSALHYMDLSGCAQLLQENLEKMQWHPEPQQSFTQHGTNGTVQHT